MKTLISIGFAVAALCAALMQPLVAHAARLVAGDLPPSSEAPAVAPVVIGQVYTAHVIYCRAVKDAEEIAQAYAAGGEPAASAMLASKRGPSVIDGVCTARAASFVVRGLASSHGGMNVIEVEDAGGSGTYYVVNATPVSKFKVERSL